MRSFIVWVLPLSFLLFGCASTSPQAQQPVRAPETVVGAGTSDDRKIINTSNQQMYDTTHAMSSDAAASPYTQNQGVP